MRGRDLIDMPVRRHGMESARVGQLRPEVRPLGFRKKHFGPKVLVRGWAARGSNPELYA